MKKWQICVHRRFVHLQYNLECSFHVSQAPNSSQNCDAQIWLSLCSQLMPHKHHKKYNIFKPWTLVIKSLLSHISIKTATLLLSHSTYLVYKSVPDRRCRFVCICCANKCGVFAVEIYEGNFNEMTSHFKRVWNPIFFFFFFSLPKISVKVEFGWQTTLQHVKNDATDFFFLYLLCLFLCKQ